MGIPCPIPVLLELVPAWKGLGASWAGEGSLPMMGWDEMGFVSIQTIPGFPDPVNWLSLTVHTCIPWIPES